MDKAEMDKLRQTIKAEYEQKIEQLKKEMVYELKALSRLESRLVGSKGRANEGIPFIRSKPTGTPTTTREYIKMVLNKIDEPFTRGKVKGLIAAEAGVEIKTGTFAPIFADLVKKGEIVEIGQQGDSRALLYKRGSVNVPAEPSQVGLFRNEEGKGEENETSNG